MVRAGDPRYGESLAEALEALSAAGSAAWRFDPARGRLRLSGALEPLGLSPLAGECDPEAFLAMTAAADREAGRALFDPRPAGALILARTRLSGSEDQRPLQWRGTSLEGGGAAGLVCLDGAFADVGRDPLTGLLDRAAFLKHVDARLKRRGTVRLASADLARLHRLNEALGPAGADLVLQALALRLAAAFPASAAPARIGEDEFGILVADDLADMDAQTQIRAALERPLRVRGFDIHPTLIVAEALAEGGEGAPDASELLRRTSLALYAAKSAGKTPGLAAAGPSRSDGLSRLALEADLHGALERGEIVPYYQPIAHLGSGRLAGFEALARWRHPVRGLVLPDDFLPLLADAGLMAAVGRHMLRHAAAQIALWRKTHPVAGDLFVAVNLSTGELDDDRLVEFVAAQVREHRLPPRALKVEITEGDVMRDPERAAVVLAALREAGAGISLDDFGTGFSSLAYLTRLPFETLKIDRYFVRTMVENEGSAKIVRSVASLGRDLGLEVVAEGVETLAVARQLHAMGCEFGQGFGYSPALDAQAAEVYLNESYLDDGAPIKISA